MTNRIGPSQISRISRRNVLTIGVIGAGLGSLGLAGCSSSGASESTTDVQPLTKATMFPSAESYKFSNIVGPQPDPTDKSKWLIDVAHSWQQKTGDTVNLHFVPVAQYEASELQTEFASGDGPDLYMISAGDFSRYYNNGAMTDLTPYLTDQARDDYVPGILKSRSVNSKIYGLPEEAQPICIFYSKNAFDQAHLTEDDIPSTWDELLEVGHKLTTKDRFGLLVEPAPGVYQNFTWYPFMWMGGGDVVKDGKCVFDSDATANALKFWQTLVNEGVSPRKALGGQSGNASANLGSGYCAMQIAGVWSVPDLAQNAKGFEYGIFKFPTPPDGNYVTIVGGWAWCVNPKSKHRDHAAKFATWALSANSPQGKKNVEDFTIAGKNMPTLKSVEDALTAPGGEYSTGVMREFVKQISTSVRSEPRYPAEVWQAVSQAIQSAQMKNEDPHKSAAVAASTITAFLKQYEGAPLV